MIIAGIGTRFVRMHTIAAHALDNIPRSPITLNAVLLATLAACVSLLASVAFGASSRQLPISVFMSDPATVAGYPFYTGLISNLGVVGWCAAATICLFSAWVLQRNGTHGIYQRFFLISGALTALLLFDDFFLLHEAFFPDYLGLPQRAVLTIYAAFLCLHLMVFAAVIARTAWLPLLIALGCFAVSAGLDQMASSLPMHLLWEDGAKLLGIASWLVYFAHAASVVLTQRTTESTGLTHAERHTAVAQQHSG